MLVSDQSVIAFKLSHVSWPRSGANHHHGLLPRFIPVWVQPRRCKITFIALLFLLVYTVKEKINTIHIAKFMYCYHNNLFHCFWTCFFENSQTHGYSTRTANNYRVHHCWTNVKKNSQSFTKVQRSGIPSLFKLLLCQAYPILRKNCWSSW